MATLTIEPADEGRVTLVLTPTCGTRPSRVGNVSAARSAQWAHLLLAFHRCVCRCCDDLAARYG